MAKKQEALDVGPGPDERSVRFTDGTIKQVPADWSLLPPGDAGLTRRVKSTGPTWTVKEKKGRKVFSHGVWAPSAQIEAAKQSVAADRADPAYARRKATDTARREKKQTAYVEDFHGAVLDFLRFDKRYQSVAQKFATAVTTLATPVGSGTVARTQRIPIERRAESAVIAWMRHQTTAYDDMKIPRVKGKRREVRRMLAEESRKRLENYRRGLDVPSNCPLMQAIATLQSTP
ncbi:hypothetical protein Pla22_48580 [Rubripirellula amarantea]|uniref:DUF2293 domain-containing protein n=1 Tax=Rubripirellula amarantea TaxID=2527999 RepID=A0A5C5WG79_9BACT|nr:DUF2293 domain-containing protein [Rubripirellula amarantea]TWT49660.1 hypothetical protein Pla22_48580 [Rubripirellula amarantea]